VSCSHVLDVAAYTLGTLDAAARDATAAHLPGCAECRAVLDSVAGLPGLLAQVDLADVLAAADAGPGREPANEPRPEPDLVQRVLREARREQTELDSRASRAARAARATRPRRRRTALVAAVLALGLLGGLAGVLSWRSGDDAGTTSLSAADGRVHAQVWLRPVSAGTSLRIRLDGVPPDQRCRLVAVGNDGRRDVAATWVADYEGGVDVVGTTSIPAPGLAWLRVETDDAAQLVSFDLRQPGSRSP